MKMRLFGVGLLFAVLALAGCSSGAATTTAAAGAPTTTTAAAGASTTTVAAGASTTTTAAAPAKISLPEGWPMEDAISADEVGAITGETMTYFPEAASSSQSGKPVGGYLVSGKAGSKIRFAADVQGGDEGFERIKQFAEASSIKEVSGIGDKAYICTFSATDHGIVVLKGNVVIRVDWNPSVYNADDEEFGKKLAGKLLDNIFE